MSSPVAEGHGVELRFGTHVALAASSFVIPARRVTAVIGPNGAGKSTLLLALTGLVRPTVGRLTVLGGDPLDTRRRISTVLQSMTVPAGTPITVREAVTMGCYARLGLFRRMDRDDRERVRRAMDLLEITDLAGRLLTELSGGQRQRVYVAQGLVQPHDVLLLDEPLTGLDLVSARTIDRIIHSECETGGTVVLTTHDLDEARAADHVLLMSGRVVACGPPQQVLTRSNLEVAYGLGALHPSEGFHDEHGHRH